MKRDLKADLELCNKATPGPWIDNGNEIVVPSNPNEGIAGALTDEDNAFISQAREGWPHAIERAIEAEALARELVDMLGRVTPRYLPRYLVGRLELDSDLVREANGLLKKAKEVLGDEA